MARLTKQELAQWESDLRKNFDNVETSIEKVALEIGVPLTGKRLTVAQLEALSFAHDLLCWGAEVAALREREKEAMRTVKSYIREGDQAGLPRAWMARAAGVTRQTVYTTLSER